MDWTRGSDDWEAENHRLHLEEAEDAWGEFCRACKEYHNPEEDCEYV